MYYDKDGRPLRGPLEWAELHSQPEYKRVALTTVTDLVTLDHWDVSTVWLGIDHAFMGGPPLIFETMVFSGSSMDLDCRRYTTEQQAIEGHTATVALVAAQATDPLVIDTTTQESECLTTFSSPSPTARGVSGASKSRRQRRALRRSRRSLLRSRSRSVRTTR